MTTVHVGLVNITTFWDINQYNQWMTNDWVGLVNTTIVYDGLVNITPFWDINQYNQSLTRDQHRYNQQAHKPFFVAILAIITFQQRYNHRCHCYIELSSLPTHHADKHNGTTGKTAMSPSECSSTSCPGFGAAKSTAPCPCLGWTGGGGDFADSSSGSTCFGWECPCFGNAN